MTLSSPRPALRAPEGERLPWLSDSPSPPRRRPVQRRNRIGMLAGAAAAALLLAGASYWAGYRSVGPRTPAERRSPAELSVSLPQVRTDPAPLPQETLEPLAAPVDSPLAASPPPPERQQAATPRQRAEVPRPGSAAAKADEQRDPAYALWPVTKVEGAAGRLVRIGSFASEADARAGWTKLLDEHPGMARLDTATVGGKSLRNGQPFYRVQVGTSSHAHSEVVCQRARALGLSCSVIGLVVADKE
jgi:hypothetical protein